MPDNDKMKKTADKKPVPFRIEAETAEKYGRCQKIFPTRIRRLMHS